MRRLENGQTLKKTLKQEVYCYTQPICKLKWIKDTDCWIHLHLVTTYIVWFLIAFLLI